MVRYHAGMKVAFVLVVVSLMLTGLPALGQGPDEQYISIYATIQEADSLLQSGQTRTAAARYSDAQTRLTRLKTAYPDWNPRIVNFRLNYIATHLATATAQLPAVPTAETATAQKPEPIAKPGEPSPEVLRELQTLRSQVGQLEADNNLLQAKLKEALSAQPAALDPRELAKAEERIRSLEKESDLLKVTLEQERGRKVATIDTAALARLREDLAESKRQLAEQTSLSKSLVEDKAELQKRLDAKASTDAAELAKAADRIKTLERETGELKASLEQARSQPVASNSTELDRLRHTLAEANRKLTEQADLAKSLAQEKAEISKRVETLSAAATTPSTELAQTKQALAEANRRLTEQTEAANRFAAENAALQKRVQTAIANTEAVAALRAENELLKKQAAEFKAGPDQSGTERELQKARALIASLQSDMEVLRAEKTALETRVKAAATPVTTTDASRVAELEQQRDVLQKKLDSALRELVRGKTGPATTRAQEAANQLAALRARIEVLEARPVPYSAEELALMKRPEPRLARVESKPAEKPSASSVTLMAEAQRSFTARQYDKAEEKYQQVLRQDDRNATTLANLAITQMELNRLDEAEKQAQQAVTVAPNNALGHSVLGQIRSRQGRYDEAVEELSRAAQLDPQSAEVQNHLGIALSHKGLRVPAESALRKAIQLEPGYGSAHNNLAVIYLNQKPPMVELARWHYQKALAAGHPKNPELEQAREAKRTTANPQ